MTDRAPTSRSARSSARRRGRAAGPVALFVAAGLLAVAGCVTDVPPSPADDLPPGEGATTGGPAPQFGVPLGADALTLRSPVRLARTASGWLLATDAGRNVVYRVDPQTLRPDQVLAIDGKPLAIGMGGDRVFVGNATRRSVEVFNHIGQRIGTLGAAGAVGYPSDLAVDGAAGLVFVLDGVDRAVKVFEIGGAPRGAFGTAATLETPIGIAVDPARREVLVSDYGNPGASHPAAVKRFSYAGELLGTIDGGGTCGPAGCRGAFSRPQGLAVDADGRVYVADALQSVILVFDRSTGALLAELAAPPGAIRLASDVALDTSGAVFVVSNLGPGLVRLSGPGASP